MGKLWNVTDFVLIFTECIKNKCFLENVPYTPIVNFILKMNPGPYNYNNIENLLLMYKIEGRK